VLLVVCCLSFIYWPLIQTRTSANSRLEVKSNTERIAGYSDAWQIIKQNPLNGIGLGNYTIALQKLKPNQPAWFYQPVHNVFILALTELGIPIFILFVTLLLYYFITRRQKLSIFNYQFSILAVVAILALFDHFWWTLPSGMLLIFVVAGPGLQPPKAVDNL
jgi:O-antigen ligase